MSIVVTDGEQRAALATVRSLGRAGHRVHVCATSPRSLAASSRFANGATVLPDPLSDPGGFAESLSAVVARCDAHILLPISEASLLAVLPERARFSSVIPFTTAERFEQICDKEVVLRMAAAVDIGVPAQHTLNSRSDLGAFHDAAFPLVLKPSRSIAGERGARVKTHVVYANDARQLAAAIETLPDSAFPILCQQRIEGPGTAISILLWDGELKAAFGHMRLREKPPSGGVSTLRESMLLDAHLLAKSVALLKAFQWHGVAMVEYKIEASTGRAYLMEINGRLWGSLQLAIDAGVDFPELLVRCALRAPVAPVLTYPPGVRTRWEWGDLDHLLARMRHSSTALALPKGAPSRMKAIKEFVAGFSPNIHSEVFTRDDPGPFFRETINWLRHR